MASILMGRLYLDKEETFAKVPLETLKELVLLG